MLMGLAEASTLKLIVCPPAVSKYSTELAGRKSIAPPAPDEAEAVKLKNNGAPPEAMRTALQVVKAVQEVAEAVEAESS